MTNIINVANITSSGLLNSSRLNSPYALRPTFYISNKIELTGEGTLSNPFRITGVG